MKIIITFQLIISMGVFAEFSSLDKNDFYKNEIIFETHTTDIKNEIGYRIKMNGIQMQKRNESIVIPNICFDIFFSNQ